MLQEGRALGWAQLQLGKVGWCIPSLQIWGGGASFRQVTEELVGSQQVWGLLRKKMLVPVTWGV